MSIINKLFSWLSAKDSSGNQIRVGYVLETEPQTIEDVEKIFNAFNLGHYLTKIEPLILPKIHLDLDEDAEDISVGVSKLGGQPDLPASVDWPKNADGLHLSFLAQLNLQEVAARITEIAMPKTGRLYFFYDVLQQADGSHPTDRNSFKVLFSTEPVVSGCSYPQDLTEDGKFQFAYPFQIEYALSIPGWEEDLVREILDDEDEENYINMMNGSEFQMFGYASCIQETMELNCEVIRKGMGMEDYYNSSEEKQKELKSGMEDWILLLQLDSTNESYGMTWGDEGRLYFWIRKQDLAAAHFENVWCIMQCH